MTDHALKHRHKFMHDSGGAVLIVIVIGIFTELFVRDKFTVSGDATATAQ